MRVIGVMFWDIRVMSPIHRALKSCPKSLESCLLYICVGKRHWSHVPYAWVRVIGVMSRVIGVMSPIHMYGYESLKSCPLCICTSHRSHVPSHWSHVPIQVIEVMSWIIVVMSPIDMYEHESLDSCPYPHKYESLESCPLYICHWIHVPRQ